MRLLDGLEGASSSIGMQFNRQETEKILSGLGSRVFLMNNAHEDVPVVFQTRWTLSYLRGPLTREQIRVLMDPLKPAETPAPAAQQVVGTTMPAVPTTTTPAVPVTPAATLASHTAGQPPALAPDVLRFFVPTRGSLPAGSFLYYVPKILGAAKVNFVDMKNRIDTTQSVIYLTPISDSAIPVDWENADEVHIALADLEKANRTEAQFGDLPAAAVQTRNYTAWSRDFEDWLYGTQKIDLMRSPSLGKVSQPNEAERDFRVRVQQETRELRDQAVDKLRQKYTPKVATLNERIRRAQQAVDREKSQASQQKLSAAVSVGATILGALMGRKTLGSSTLGRASTAARGVSRAVESGKDIGRASDTVEALQQQLNELQAQFTDESNYLVTKTDPQTEALDSITVKPKKADITVQLVALVWVPHWKSSQGVLTSAF
jgi:hypothetical protein